MNSDFLGTLFEELDRNKVDYLVLRGYQNLPKSYSNDIDFSVVDENELCSFFDVIQNLSIKYRFALSRDVVRVGLLKVFLHFDDHILKIDVFHTFQYAGLVYMDIKKLHDTKRKIPSGIFVPLLNFELAISLLKEILHNSRIRFDKVALLREQFDSSTFSDPFIYFSGRNVLEIQEALFAKDKLVFKNLSFRIRLSLLYSNLKCYGLIIVCKRIFMFLFVKYLDVARYDEVIYGNLKS